ncbi:CBS domain-containing protein [Anaerorhabdus sp.]|uniref:CBS domain-containing protein n=1 Tax=Anaerorhabdus sp. TaxID=1872524 RepID=UPI002FCCAE8A
MDNAQRFLSAYAAIEKSLKQITGKTKYVKFYQLMQEASYKNKFVQKYEVELQEYAELRNAIVHQRDGVGKIIAQPTLETVEDIEKIAELLDEYHPVSKYFLKKVLTCTLEEPILLVQKRMQENNISKIPVYSDKGIIGILTVEAIAKWACAKLENRTEANQVHDIYEGISENEKVFFLSKNASVYEVIRIYNTSMKNGQLVLAIIITEEGIKTQKPIGIITVKDLPILFEYF